MASSYPMLRYGSSGQEVRRLQQALNRAGYSLEVDGGFGEKTRAALMDYQRRAGMTPDGVAGSKTWASLGLQSAQDRLADLEKGYTPSRETQEARRSWEELAARQPGDYTSPYADRMEDLLRQMESREAFSYDPSRDEMFRRYARLYQRQGQTAMEDTLGQAAGLTGGYDSSYARQAGQQEYNRYMQELAALVPQLQQDAWDRYETQGQALLDQYKLLQGQDEDAYGQWRDRVEDWQDASRQARDRYESLEKQDYSNYLALMKYYASRAKQEQDAALAQMKKSYDENRTTQFGVGAHLYAYTGRGEDDSGFHDWRSFLPVPMPYSYEPSLVDHAQELLALYDEGERKGIIYGQPVNQNGNQAAAQTAQNAQNAQTAQNAQNTQNTNYYIRQSAPQDIPEYKLEDFVVNGQLNAGDLQREKRRLQDLLAGMYDPANGGRQVALKNDGAVSAGTACVDRVRKDYFVHYPMLQRIVRQELEKQEKIYRAMEQLDQIEEEFTQYKTDMTTFTNMVFYGMIECLSATGEPEYDRISRAFYKYRDRRGMETEKILVEDSKAFRFGKKYPLYEMFRSYRAMEPDEEPRQEMDEREAELRKQTRGANDHLIAAALEKRWNAKALQQLVRDTANEKDEDKAEIRRFYEELVSRILGYKDVFTDEQWTRTSKVASNPTPAASAQQAPARTWTVSPGGSTIYTVYSDRSLQMAWDAVNNTWVPLTAGMWVLNKAGDGWETIQLDAAGNIING